MSSRSRKRKRTVTSVVEVEEAAPTRQGTKPSEEDDEMTQDAPTARPSRNRRKSVKLAEAEDSAKPPVEETRRLNIISLHHEKGGRKDAGDSWTITSSSKPRRQPAPSKRDDEADGEQQEAEEGGGGGEEGKSRLLHLVSKGKQQTIKIKPLHKPEPEDKPASSRSSKKSQPKAVPSVAVKEDSGLKLKLILSPKDKGKDVAEAGGREVPKDKRSASRGKSGKSSAKDKDEPLKAKFVFGDQVLRVEGDKILVGQSKKRKHGDAEAESTDSPAAGRGNKKQRTAPTEEPPMAKKAGKSTPGNKSTSKVDTKAVPTEKSTSKGSSKNSRKTSDKSAQSDNKSKAKPPPEEIDAQSSDASKKDDDKAKKKRAKADKTAASNFNLLSLDESVDELVVDEPRAESPRRARQDKAKSEKKKKANDSDSSHKSKKHKSKDGKRHKAKFITTGTKKPGRNVGLDPVTASHMFGQFDGVAQRTESGLDGPGLDDESFFMAGSDATMPSFPDAEAMGIPELGFPSGFGTKSAKKDGKKLSKKDEKKRKKKKKDKDKLKKDEKAKKPLSAYMLWCGQTRRKVVAQNPGLDFSGISRMMGTLWQQLPEKEKQAWYSKQRLQNVKHKNVPSLSKQKFRRSGPSRKASRSPHGSPARHFSPRTEPIDSAAHLKLLGESLSLVGDRLQNHVGHVEIHGSLSVLLDSTLCCLAPLMSLTGKVPELNSISKDTIASTMDNIAYIMPGLG